jgi:hypothetical protein
MKIYVSDQGKPYFHGGNIFPIAHKVFCVMPGLKLCSPLRKEKLPEILFIPSVFSSFPGWKNIPSWGAGKRGKLPACGKKPKEHLHPLQVCK